MLKSFIHYLEGQSESWVGLDAGLKTGGDADLENWDLALTENRVPRFTQRWVR